MFASSQIIFVNARGDACLEWLFAELPKHIPFRCSRTEWVGFTTTIPQILIETAPVALTIQVDDDPEYVPEEIAELADEMESKLPPDVHAELKKCNARLDVMSASSNEPEITEEAITVVAQTDLDPQSDQVDRVVRALSKLCNGFVNDCIYGGLLCPGDDTWIT